MIKKLAAVLISCSLMVTYSGCATYKKHPDFAERQPELRSGAVMPPNVEIYELTFKGDRNMLFDLIDHVSENSKTILKDIFQEKGYQIHSLGLDNVLVDDEKDLKAALFNAQELFKQSLDDIKHRRQKKFTYTIGPDVNIFADRADADFLVFVKEEGFKKSKGEIAKDAVKSVVFAAVAAAMGGSCFVMNYSAAGVIEIAIVDSDNGDILWYNRVEEVGYYLNLANELRLNDAFERLLRPFPDAAGKTTMDDGREMKDEINNIQ